MLTAFPSVMLSASEASPHSCHAERQRSISEILRSAQNDKQECPAERSSVMLSVSEASLVIGTPRFFAALRMTGEECPAERFSVMLSASEASLSLCHAER
jgi:hypothetical protein